MKSIEDLDLAGRRVFVRVDYNVPFAPNSTDISDDSRIVASLDTVRYLIERDFNYEDAREVANSVRESLGKDDVRKKDMVQLVDKVIQAVVDAANSGRIGDGKIFVQALEDVVRIRTGERGAEAV